MANQTNFLSSLKNLGNQWYNVIVIIILLGTGIGNYMVSQYRHDQNEKDIAELSLRVKAVEGINYELLLAQLDEFNKSNDELKAKFDKTNERIDNVLEILLSK